MNYQSLKSWEKLILSTWKKPSMFNQAMHGYHAWLWRLLQVWVLALWSQPGGCFSRVIPLEGFPRKMALDLGIICEISNWWQWIPYGDAWIDLIRKKWGKVFLKAWISSNLHGFSWCWKTTSWNSENKFFFLLLIGKCHTGSMNVWWRGVLKHLTFSRQKYLQSRPILWLPSYLGNHHKSSSVYF